MKLSIAERLNLSFLLPKESDYLTLKKLVKLSERLNFTDDEIKTYDIKNNVDGDKSYFSWNDEGKKYKADIEIGEVCEDVIVAKLKKLDDEKKLDGANLPLYEKFVEKNFTDELSEEVAEEKTDETPA